MVADRGALDLEHDLHESRCHIGAGDRPQRRADRLDLLVRGRQRPSLMDWVSVCAGPGRLS